MHVLGVAADQLRDGHDALLEGRDRVREEAELEHAVTLVQIIVEPLKVGPMERLHLLALVANGLALGLRLFHLGHLLLIVVEPVDLHL